MKDKKNKRQKIERTTEFDNTMKFLVNSIIVLFKSMFQTVVDFIWFFAGIVLITGLFAQYKINTDTLKEFFNVLGFVANNWIIYFILIFLFYFIINIRKLYHGEK